MSGANGDIKINLHPKLDLLSVGSDIVYYVKQAPTLKTNISAACLTEYEAVNSMLDQINSYLDDLEERNDVLNGKLHELMQSNRQARLEFRAQLMGPVAVEESDPMDGDSKGDMNEDGEAGK